MCTSFFCQSVFCAPPCGGHRLLAQSLIMAMAAPQTTSSTLEEEHERMRKNLEALYTTLGKSMTTAPKEEAPGAAAAGITSSSSIPLSAAPTPAATVPLPKLATDYSTTPVYPGFASTAAWSPPPPMPLPTPTGAAVPSVSAEQSSVIELTGELQSS